MSRPAPDPAIRPLVDVPARCLLGTGVPRAPPSLPSSCRSKWHRAAGCSSRNPESSFQHTPPRGAPHPAAHTRAGRSRWGCSAASQPGPLPTLLPQPTLLEATVPAQRAIALKRPSDRGHPTGDAPAGRAPTAGRPAVHRGPVTATPRPVGSLSHPKYPHVSIKQKPE